MNILRLYHPSKHITRSCAQRKRRADSLLMGLTVKVWCICGGMSQFSLDSYNWLKWTRTKQIIEWNIHNLPYGNNFRNTTGCKSWSNRKLPNKHYRGSVATRVSYRKGGILLRHNTEWFIAPEHKCWSASEEISLKEMPLFSSFIGLISAIYLHTCKWPMLSWMEIRKKPQGGLHINTKGKDGPVILVWLRLEHTPHWHESLN